ncbi:MAG TPA: PKD domain-containing protein, partial [Euryarchaeota archaeon]|nr:PKD domain-containing protein [Euryarchaeota archaeon]
MVFNGTTSTDNVGVVSWEWDFGEGNTTSGEVVFFTFTMPGIYTVTLNVTDDAGNWNIAQQAVTVRDITPPICDFVASPSFTIDHGTTLTLSSTSTDNVGIAAHSWDIDGDGIEDFNTPVIVVNFTWPGIYVVNLTVADAAGNQGWAEHEITVIDIVNPTAIITTTWGNETDEGLQRSFSSALSYDDWGIANRSWDLNGDGNADSYVANPFWTYNEPGVYLVTLTITDLQGNTGTDMLEITVNDVTNPVASIDTISMVSGNPVLGYHNGPLTVTVTATDNVGISHISLYTGTVHPNRLLATAYYAVDNVFTVNINSTDLPQGLSDLVAQVTDTSGNTAQATTTIRVDTLPPVMSFTLGGPLHVVGDITYITTGTTLTLTGIDDHAGLESLEVSFSTEGVLFSQTFNESVNSHTLPPISVPLVEGMLTLRAVDMLGNENVTDIPVSYTLLGDTQFVPDTLGPSITLLTYTGSEIPQIVNSTVIPPGGLPVSIRTRFILEGFDNGSGVAEINVEVGYPNSQQFTVNPGESFNVHLGAAYIRCTGIDELGNAGEEIYVRLDLDYYGQMTVKTDLMIFGWTEPSGGGYLTWTLSGDLATDLRNQIIEQYDRDLPGMPGYGRIDEAEANAYLVDVEQSTAVRSLENPDTSNRERRLLYWGTQTNRYDPKYGGYDTNNDLTQSVQGMINYRYNEEGPITIDFQFSAEYLSGRQIPNLVEDFFIQVLYSPFRKGYVYDGPVSYSHQHVMVGLPAYYNPSVTDGSLFILRTPIGEVVWYSVEYSGNASKDKMETKDFDFVESPFVLFLTVMVGAYLTNYLPSKFYSDMRDQIPRRLRIRARRIKSLHISSVFLILLLVGVYIVPSPFVLFGSNFFFAGYIAMILSFLFPLLLGLTSFFLYRNKKDDLLGVKKDEEESSFETVPSTSDYQPVPTKTVATAPA